MKKTFVLILSIVLSAGLMSCMPASYTIPDETREFEPATRENLPTEDPASDTSPSAPETDAPTDPVVPPESKEPSENASTSAPYSDPDQGVLRDLGIWPDAADLPNDSIPYGNDWEDRDQYGIANGIHWYEAKFGKYGPVYRVDTTEKILYLTMDEGYEAGHTPVILDILKEKNVKAVFFITKQFYDSDPDLIRRMIEEGHILGNHTCAHPAGGYPKYVDAHGLQSFVDDISRLHKLIYDSFGYKMKLFRFPEGESSERLMAVLQNYGYTPVFWSYAHRDFVMDDQPEVSVTLDRCLNHMGSGAVYLLHAVSSSNTAALSDFIDRARAAGYEFGVFPVDEVSKAH